MSCAISKAMRPAACAGRFYEADGAALRATIAKLMEGCPSVPYCRAPVALIAPHAGYVYSGSVAAAAYRTVQGRSFDRVLILAPTHTSSFQGAALPEAAGFQTPLGPVPVDQRAVEQMCDHPLFSVLPAAHAEEHAIEVEFPFLQASLAGPFKILPLALGELPARGFEQLADALAGLIEERRREGQRWLAVASSDTYHGYDAEACRANDAALQLTLEAMNVDELVSRSRGRKIMACGWKAIALTMMLAERLGAKTCRITGRSDSSRAESGGKRGAPGRYVVGYLSAAFE